MTKEARDLSPKHNENKSRDLENLTNKLFAAGKRHWDDAFTWSDSSYDTYATGMGDVWIRHLRMYERELLQHRMLFAGRPEHEIQILEYVKGEMFQRVLIDGAPVALISPYLHTVALELLTGGFVAEDALRDHALTASDLVRDVDFLNSNFGLGLHLSTRTEDERVLFSVTRPEATKVTLQGASSGN